MRCPGRVHPKGYGGNGNGNGNGHGGGGVGRPGGSATAGHDGRHTAEHHAGHTAEHYAERDTVRSIWNGAISFGLVSIPIKLVNATESHSISFRQIHLEDGGRIRYRKVCELDGQDLSEDDIGKTPHVAMPSSSGDEPSEHGAVVEPLVPLVGVRSGGGAQHRVGAGLDEVQQGPGNAVAVVRAEAGDQRLRFLPSDRLRDRSKLLIASVDLFFARVPVGERAVGDECLDLRSHVRIVRCCRSPGQDAWASSA